MVFIAGLLYCVASDCRPTGVHVILSTSCILANQSHKCLTVDCPYQTLLTLYLTFLEYLECFAWFACPGLISWNKCFLICSISF